MAFLTINGVDIDALGLKLIDQGPIWSGVGYARGSAGVLGRVGQRTLGVSTSPAQQINLDLAMPGDPASRRAALDNVIRALDGLLELAWSDAPGRVQYARLERSTIGARFAQIAWLPQGQLRLSLSLVADVPVWFERDVATSAWAANGRAEVTPGTLTSEPVVILPGPIATAVTVTYESFAGTVLSALVLSDPAISASQTLLIDSGTERIFIDSGAGPVAAQGLYSSGSFPVFDPGDGTGNLPPRIGANVGGVANYVRVFE